MTKQQLITYTAKAGNRHMHGSIIAPLFFFFFFFGGGGGGSFPFGEKC